MQTLDAITHADASGGLARCLSAAERRTLSAAIRRIVLDPPDDLGARVEHRIAGLVPHKVHEVCSGLRLFGSGAAALISVQRPGAFHTLAPALQDRMLTAWGDSALPQARTLYQLVRQLTLATHYADPRTYASIGYRGPLHLREAAVPWEGPATPLANAESVADPVLRDASQWIRSPARRPAPAGVITAATFRDTGVVTADAVVIGSGAGGAVAAARLAEAGKSVVILEAGDFIQSDEFTEQDGPMTDQLFAERGMRSTDDLAVSILQGATVGGGTTVNWMIMLRTPAHVLAEWASRHGMDGMSATEMEPVFRRIEREVHAARVADDSHSVNNRLLIDGARRLGWRVESAVINARGCVRSGFCSHGCRYDAKQGTLQTYLPRALAHGATLYANAQAARIDVVSRGEGVRGMTTKRVTATVRPPHGDARAQTLTIEAPVVIVAGGAVETPLLLQRSAMGGGGVGRFLRLHPTTAILGVHDSEVQGAAGIPLSAMCDEFIQRDRNGYGFWLECPPMHPMVGAAAIQGFGATHAAMMRKFPYLASTVALTRDGSQHDHSSGSVTLDSQGCARIRYALSPADASNVRASIEASVKLQLAAGAREVYTMHSTPMVFDQNTDLAPLHQRSVAANRLSLFSAHANGTCRIGTDPATSGVSPTGERHGVRGVYVLDGSMLPTGVGVNPQETIMAISSVLTDRLLDRWP